MKGERQFERLRSHRRDEMAYFARGGTSPGRHRCFKRLLAMKPSNAGTLLSFVPILVLLQTPARDETPATSGVPGEGSLLALLQTPVRDKSPCIPSVL